MPDEIDIHLARTLHDGIAQELVAIGYKVDLILANSELPMESRSDLRALRSEITRLTQSVRDEIFLLREPVQENLHDFLHRITANTGSRISIIVEELALENILDTELRYVAGELTRNAITHAGASRIDISITNQGDSIQLLIIDDGIGGAAEKDGHFGLRGVRERVALLGGNIIIDSEKGTSIWVSIPREVS